MLRVRHFLMALSLAVFPLGCAPAGCSGEDPELDKPAAEQIEGAVEQQIAAPAPGAKSMFGTWTGDPLAGHFAKLVLMTDARFHSEETVTCIKAPCPPITKDGQFKLFAREGRTFLELNARGETVPARFEYAMSGDALRIRPLVMGSEWYAMKFSSTAWCNVERDCQFQNLPTGPCAGAYACGENACSWKCSGGTTADAKPMDPNAPAAMNPIGLDGTKVAADAMCPKEGDCVIANGNCQSNARDTAACATVDSCKKCFPNGWDPKKLPETADPGANPVLKK